jgi:hypothetical protein
MRLKPTVQSPRVALVSANFTQGRPNRRRAAATPPNLGGGLQERGVVRSGPSRSAARASGRVQQRFLNAMQPAGSGIGAMLIDQLIDQPLEAVASPRRVGWRAGIVAHG